MMNESGRSSRRHRSHSCGEAFPFTEISVQCGDSPSVSPALQKNPSQNSETSLDRFRVKISRDVSCDYRRSYSREPEDSGHVASRDEGNACGSHLTVSSSSGFSSASSVNFFDGRIRLSLPEPPDGGWGWVVVFASFICHTVADGVPLSFGILFVDLSNTFNQSKSYTALVGALMLAVPAIFAPITSALMNEYGCRVVCMVGSLLCTCGYILSFFMDSILGLIFSIGIVTGIGQSLILLPSIVIVANYFYVQRAFAMGLSIAGLGVGSFIFAPVLDVLLTHYTWRGTMLILAGIYLNLLICGALYRPVESKRKKQQRRRVLVLEKFARKSGVILNVSKEYESMTPHEKILHLKELLLPYGKGAPSTTFSIETTQLLSNHNKSTSLLVDINAEEDSGAISSVEDMSPTFPYVEQINTSNRTILPEDHGKDHYRALVLNSPRLATIRENEILSQEELDHGERGKLLSLSIMDEMEEDEVSPKEVRFDVDEKLESDEQIGHEEANALNTPSFSNVLLRQRSIDEDCEANIIRLSRSIINSVSVTNPDTESMANTSLKSHSMGDLTLLNSLLKKVALPVMKQAPSDPELYRRKCTHLGEERNSSCSYFYLHHADYEMAYPKMTNFTTQDNHFFAPPSPSNSVINSLVSILFNSGHLTTAVHKLQRQEVRNALARYHMRRSVPFDPSNFPLASGEPSHLEVPATVVNNECFNSPFQRLDVFFRGSLLRLNRLERRQRRTVSLPLVLPSTDRIPEADETSDMESWVLSSEAPNRCNGVYDLLLIKRMMDLTVFSSFYFVLFFVSNFLLFIFFNIINFYMVDYVEGMGLTTSQGAMLMSTVGIASTIGQVLVGFLADKDGIDVLILYVVCITVCGLGTTLVPCSNDYVFLTIYCASYGLNIAANDALTSVILAEYMGLEKLTNAMGIMMFGQGIGNVIGPSLIGFIIDGYSYAIAFVVCGIGILTSAMCVLVLVIYENHAKCTRLSIQKLLP